MLNCKKTVRTALGLLVASCAFGTIPAGPEMLVGACEPQAGEGKKVVPGQPAQKVDLHGDPLPPGAIARMGTVRFRSHTDVLCAALSPDGKIAVTAPHDTLIFWDAATGKELRRTRAHDSAIYCLEYSVDGKVLASGSGDRAVRLWDPARGKLLRELPKSEQAVFHLAFSADGKILAGTGNGPVAAPVMPPGKPLAPPPAKNLLAVQPLPGMVQPMRRPPAMMMGDDALILWDLTTGKEIRRLVGHLQAYALAFSPNGKILASCHPDGWVLWETNSGKKIRHCPLVPMVYSVHFSPDGKTLATTSHDGTIRLWNVATGQENARFQADPAMVVWAKFSPDGKTLLSDGLSSVSLWDLTTRREMWRMDRVEIYRFYLVVSANFETLLLGGRTAICISPVGPAKEPKVALSAAEAAKIETAIADLGHKEFKRRQAASDDLWVLRDKAYPALLKAAKQSDFEVKRRVEVLLAKLHNERDMVYKKRQRSTNHQDPVHKAVFSADGKTLTTYGAFDCREWETATGKPLRATVGRQDLKGCGDTSIASADGKLTANLDRNAGRIQIRKAGKLIHDWVPHQGRLTAAAFTPDGKLLVTAGEGDKCITFWSVATGKAVGQFHGPQGWITWLAFSPDGQKLASASVDTTILVWDVAVACK